MLKALGGPTNVYSVGLTGAQPSLRINSAGDYFISFYDEGTQDLMLALKRKEMEWEVIEVDTEGMVGEPRRRWTSVPTDASTSATTTSRTRWCESPLATETETLESTAPLALGSGALYALADADPVCVSNERCGRLDSLVADTKSHQRLTPFYRLADLLVQCEAHPGMDVLARMLSTRTQHEGCATDLERITGGDGSRLVGFDHAFLTACTEERASGSPPWATTIRQNRS